MKNLSTQLVTCVCLFDQKKKNWLRVCVRHAHSVLSKASMNETYFNTELFGTFYNFL